MIYPYSAEQETEEEKKRREQAAAYQAPVSEASGAIQPVEAPGFFSQVGQGIQQGLENRLNTATQAFANPGLTLQNRFAGATQNLIPQQVTPVAPAAEPQDLSTTEVQSQKIKTYGDGSQEHTVTTQIPAGQSPAPAQAQPMEIPQVPTPGPGVQLAGPMVAGAAGGFPSAPAQAQPVMAVAPTTNQAPALAQAQPVTAPVNPLAAPAQPQLAPAGVGANAEGTAGEAEAQANMLKPGLNAFQQLAAQKQAEKTPEEIHHEAIVNTRNETDPAKRREAYVTLLSDKSVSPENKALANRFIAEDYMKERDRAEAEKKIDEATPNDLARYMREKSGREGSLVKAILYARLGLTDLAQKEQDLINPALRTSSELDDAGNKYTVERDREGNITRAFNAQGKTASQEELSRLSAGAVMKGATTGQTMGYDRAGNVISHTILKNGDVVWKNQTTGETLKSAPAGYHTGKNQQEALGDQAYARSRSADEQINRANEKKGLAPVYTPEQMEQRAQDKRNGILGLGSTTYGAGPAPAAAPATTAATTVAAPAAEFADSSIRLISGNRPREQQQAMWDESVRAGRTGRTAEGNPIARPGTSLHETNQAIDVSTKDLTRAGRAELAAKGYYQPIPDKDPNHWELLPGREAPRAATQPVGAAPTITQIRQSNAQRIANYQAPPLSGSGQGGENAMTMAEVYKINPNYNPVEAKQKIHENQNIINSFSDSSKPANKSIQALKTATNHISDLMPTIDNLQNGRYPTANAIANAFDKYTGGSRVTNMEAIGPAVGAEIMKSFNPSMGTVEERRHIADSFNAARSPEQLKEAVKLYEGLMVGKLKPLADDYERTGRKDFWPMVVKDPAVKNMYDRHMAEQNVRNNIPASGTTSTGVKFKVIQQ